MKLNIRYLYIYILILTEKLYIIFLNLSKKDIDKLNILGYLIFINLFFLYFLIYDFNLEKFNYLKINGIRCFQAKK